MGSPMVKYENVLISGGTFNYTNYHDPEKIADKISDISFDKTYQAISSSRTKDTGQWLLEHETFKTWRDSDPTHSILWIVGEPGIGKTYLSSLVIQHLFEETRAVAFLLCDHTKELSINDLLGSLLRQLVIHLPASTAVSEWWNGAKQPLTTDQLNDLLLAQMGDAIVYIISDALDECKAQSELITTFRRLIRAGRAHIIITTRPNLAHLIENHDFRIDAKSLGDDIWKFVDQYISNPKEDRFKCLQRLVSRANPTNGQPFRNYLIEEVVKKASERFLIARLQIDALAKANNRKELTAALRDLSSDINQMYEQNIRRIPENVQRMAFQVFSWVVFAYEPLYVSELQHAIAIDLVDEISGIEDVIYPWETILEGCAGLLMTKNGFSSESEVVLVHETTYEYFRRKIPGNALFNQPSDLGFACVKYLTFNEDVFTSYAARYWGMHCANLPENAAFALPQLLEKHATEVVRKTSDKMTQYNVRGWPKWAGKQTLIHILCWFGLDSLVLEFNNDIEVRDSDGWTPVFYAASMNNVDVVKLLVEKGADINLVDNDGKSPLSYAAKSYNSEMVKILVEKGADNNLVDNDGRSALSYAAQSYNSEMVRILVEKGADINLVDNDGKSALSYAAQSYNSEMVKILVEKGADINLVDNHGRSIFSYAVEGGNPETVKILVENGADINLVDNDGRSVLSYAAQSYDSETVKILVEKGADINLVDNDGRSALSYAAQSYNSETVKILVEEGADINLVDNNGRSILSYATEWSNSETVQFLIKKGVDINFVDNNGRSALSYAHNSEMAKILVETGADTMKEGSDWFAVTNPNPKLDVDLVHTLTHESAVHCVRFSADGKFLATGCTRTAQIYDTRTGAIVCVLADDSTGESGNFYIHSVCFSSDGKFLATGSEDKLIRIWDIAKKCICNTFEGHQQEIYSLNFLLDDQLIVSGSYDGTVRIWDVHDGTSKVLTINDPDSLDNYFTSATISPNGHFVAAACLDTVIGIWDVQTGVLVDQLRGNSYNVCSIAFTPDGKGLVSGKLDGLEYWDVRGLAAGGSGKGRTDAAAYNGGAASPVTSSSSNKVDKSVMVSTGGDSMDGNSSGTGLESTCTMNFTGQICELPVAVSHDGQWIVSGSKDEGVQFWDVQTAIIQCMLKGHKHSVHSLDLSPAGNVLATGSRDCQARIWSYNTI